MSSVMIIACRPSPQKMKRWPITKKNEVRSCCKSNFPSRFVKLQGKLDTIASGNKKL